MKPRRCSRTLDRGFLLPVKLPVFPGCQRCSVGGEGLPLVVALLLILWPGPQPGCRRGLSQLTLSSALRVLFPDLGEVAELMFFVPCKKSGGDELCGFVSGLAIFVVFLPQLGIRYLPAGQPFNLQPIRCFPLAINLRDFRCWENPSLEPLLNGAGRPLTCSANIAEASVSKNLMNFL